MFAVRTWNDDAKRCILKVTQQQTARSFDSAAYTQTDPPGGSTRPRTICSSVVSIFLCLSTLSCENRCSAYTAAIHGQFGTLSTEKKDDEILYQPFLLYMKLYINAELLFSSSFTVVLANLYCTMYSTHNMLYTNTAERFEHNNLLLIKYQIKGPTDQVTTTNDIMHNYNYKNID